MITIKNLSKSFGEKKLFENYSLQINDGEFVIFTGVSGCGKTTLLNMIGSLESADSGEIEVDGMDITQKKNQREYLKRKVGFLFQNFALVDNKTVEENLRLVKNDCRSGVSIEEALEMVGLSDKAKQKVYSLSGGEQQRAALARLIVKKCDCVLADEPTASCIYTQKGNKKIRKPQAANQTALIFDRRAAARLLSINSIRRLCWS